MYCNHFTIWIAASFLRSSGWRYRKVLGLEQLWTSNTSNEFHGAIMIYTCFGCFMLRYWWIAFDLTALMGCADWTRFVDGRRPTYARYSVCLWRRCTVNSIGLGTSMRRVLHRERLTIAFYLSFCMISAVCAFCASLARLRGLTCDCRSKIVPWW